MWPFRNKFEKIKRSDVVESIIEIEKKQNDEIDAVNERNAQIAQLKKQGMKIHDRDMRLALAKKINRLLAENKQSTARVQYLNANISALTQLKNALDDRDFITNNTNMPLNALLNDTKMLRKFLASVNSKKMVGETGLVNALDVFEEAEEAYEGDERIYAASDDDDKLLAMFELDESNEDAAMFGNADTDDMSAINEESSGN